LGPLAGFHVLHYDLPTLDEDRRSPLIEPRPERQRAPELPLARVTKSSRRYRASVGGRLRPLREAHAAASEGCPSARTSHGGLPATQPRPSRPQAVRAGTAAYEAR